MSAAEQLLTKNLSTLALAVQSKSSSGRGSSKKIDLYGIKKLRELILELAVRGKLVPQNPEDEPASKLLERVEAEKTELVAEKKIKKPKKLPVISNDDQPFESLPKQWEWVRLNDLGEWGAGATPRRGSSELYGGDIPWFKSGELSSDYISKSEETVTELALKQSSLRYNNIGDVLVAMYGATIGKTAILNVRATTNQAVCACTPFTGFLNTYLLLLLKAFKGRLIGMGAGGAQPNISREKIIATVIALPPEAEQHRIVAKVDELMALCDQIEQQTEASLSAHTTLVENLLATLTTSANAEELKQNWQRIASHFTTLFTTEASIDQLKQTILQLAVMGKLVPQNPNDEPAAKLLERIAEEKAELIKEGKIKKQKPLPPITEDEKPFELPEGWEWCRFSEVVNEVATGPFGSMIHKSDYIEGGVPLINPSHMLESKIVEDTTISISPGKAEELKSYKLMPGDIVMARRGEMGRCALVTEREESWLCGTGSFVLKFNAEIDRQYLLLLFKTSWVREYLGGNSVGSTMTNLNHGILNKMPLLLPSLAEQYRIVTKVNQLMILCDQIKTHLQHQQKTRLHLADALVQEALL